MYSKNYIFTPKVTHETTLYEEATQHPRWREAMKQEYESIMKNETWILVNLQLRKVIITMKWVYKMKTTTNGNVKKLKVSLVAQGFEQ
jgi:histone deacetylase 1/2